MKRIAFRRARTACCWVESQPVSTVIVGIETVAEMEENVALARDFTPLSQDQLAALSAKTQPIAEQALWFRRFNRS